MIATTNGSMAIIMIIFQSLYLLLLLLLILYLCMCVWFNKNEGII